MRKTLLLLAVAALASCGGGEKTIPENGDLPNVGLGEAAPPSIDASGWRTDFRKHTVPLSEFQSGGPVKDGIPAIDRPRFGPARTIRFLEAREPVVELELGGHVRAYPIQILIWHEIVNDTVAGTPVAPHLLPALQHGDRPAGGPADARLRNDRQPPGLGSGHVRPADGVVVAAVRRRGRRRRARGDAPAPAARAHRRLERVRTRPSRGLVLTRNTGFSRSYGQNPYAGYDNVDSSPLFPVKNSDDKRLPPKERVIFIERGQDAVAIPFSTLAKRPTLSFNVGGHQLVVRWHRDVGSPLDDVAVGLGRRVGAAEVRENGRLVPFDEPFWFAVAAFRPYARIVR